MIVGYVDETGDPCDEARGVFGLGGFVGAVADWEKFAPSVIGVSRYEVSRNFSGMRSRLSQADTQHEQDCGHHHQPSFESRTVRV